MLRRFNANSWGLAATGLFLSLAIACGTAASPSEQPEAAETAPTVEMEQAATPVAETFRKEPAAVSEPTAIPVTSGATNNPAPEAPPAATVSAITAADPAPTASPTAAPDPTKAEVGAEPDWARELRLAGINIGIWETNFSKHSVPYNEIFSGGVPRDGIPPIDDPRFVSVEEADKWLEDKEPVIALEINGEAKAYPLQILTWHEIANDTVAGVPVSVTFCPLCNSAIVVDRRLDGEVYDFGVSGNLRNSDLIMWDRQTQSWWQQLTGEAIVGQLTGAQLDILPATLTAWQDFRVTYPGSQVLSRDTGYRRSYGANPYAGYDEVGRSPFLFFGQEDDRLLPMERVAAVTVSGESAAFPFASLESELVAHHSLGGQDLVVFFKPGARSALDQRSIADSREVGSTAIFLRYLDGQLLTFERDGEEFVDQETGTRWNIFGQGLSGIHAGKRLTPVEHANHFWFAWAAFRPDTTVVRE